MPANLLIRYAIGFSLLICSLVSQAQQLLNGVAVHQELGQDMFIGAVYSDTLSSKPEALLQGKQAMRMELKVVSPDGLSTRRFSRLWIEGMAVNNTNNVLTQQADNMVKFDGLFKGRFTTNDHIVFSNVPGRGVDIIVNNSVIGNIKDNAFFSMLLSTWIGKVPLSSDFRDGLLKMGDVDDSLRGRFVSITPSAARVAEVASLAPPQPAAVPTTPTGPTTKPTAATKASVAAAPEPSKVAKVDSPPATASIDKPAVTVPVPSPVVSAPTPPVTSSRPPVTTPVVAAPTPKSVAASSAKPVTAAPKPVTVAKAAIDDEDEDEGAPALTAQSLLARQFYVSDAIKKIRSNTTYPQRAAEKGQEGSIRIAVVVNREGKVLETKVLEESKHSLLNKEASAAIGRSSPFAPLPAALPGKKFEFTVPIRFAIPRPQQ